MSERNCDNCANATEDFNNDIDTGCYMCCKGLENNYIAKEDETTDMECNTECPCNVNGKCTWVANYDSCKSKVN